MNYHANLKPENYEWRGEEEEEGETEKQENGRTNAKRTKLDRRSCGRGRNSPDQRPDAPSIQADAAKQRQEEAREGKAGKTKPGGGGTEDNERHAKWMGKRRTGNLCVQRSHMQCATAR